MDVTDSDVALKILEMKKWVEMGGAEVMAGPVGSVRCRAEEERVRGGPVEFVHNTEERK